MGVLKYSKALKIPSSNKLRGLTKLTLRALSDPSSSRGFQAKKPLRSDKLLIVGLGNPGNEYEFTRHNAGFLCLDNLANRWNAKLTFSSKFNSEYGACAISNKSIGLLKPMTFMNLSGSPVKRISAHFELKPADLLVLYDDADYDWGAVKVRPGGSSRGHNGLKDIESALGTREFARLGVGIGRNDRVSMTEHVLGSFSSIERQQLGDILNKASDMVEQWIAS